MSLKPVWNPDFILLEILTFLLPTDSTYLPISPLMWQNLWPTVKKTWSSTSLFNNQVALRKNPRACRGYNQAWKLSGERARASILLRRKHGRWKRESIQQRLVNEAEQAGQKDLKHLTGAAARSSLSTEPSRTKTKEPLWLSFVKAFELVF